MKQLELPFKVEEEDDAPDAPGYEWEFDDGVT